MKKTLVVLQLLLCALCQGQGYNHTWLYGPDAGFPMGRVNFNVTGPNVITEQRKMTFETTQGNISDANGNFLMSSNGVWIANATGDTMMNGSGLNPGAFVSSNPKGLGLTFANVMLPHPADTTRYVLIHHSATYNGWYYPANQIFNTVIDMTVNGGLGAVTVKNDLILTDTLNWGIGACRHANGRDWWIVVQKDSTDILFKTLLTPTGVQPFTSQKLNVPVAWGNVTQLTFSPDGKKFAYSTYHPQTVDASVLVFDFNRCTGQFSNPVVVPVTINTPLWGLSFSPNSQYVYTTTSQKVYQINTDTSNIPASLITVAVNDTFYSPWPPFQTDFRTMYLAANGKIYITSGNAVGHHHIISEPDSSGLASNVQQHALYLNGAWNFRSVPNHPNYYLGCDTTCGPCLNVGIAEVPGQHNFKFSLSPNPTSGAFKIVYLLPQNKAGVLEVYDVRGRKVYGQALPQWSTLQHISLPKAVGNGIYSVIITSGGERVSGKLVVIE